MSTAASAPFAAAELAALSALAGGIIPADTRDAGAQGCGPAIAERAHRAGTLPLYAAGLAAASQTARAQFSREITQLAPTELQALLAAIAAASPAFFRALRADTCATYLADPAVLRRIGFPGPSTETGGYPTFDQPPVIDRGLDAAR